MDRHQLKESRITKNQVNMTPPKETKKALITDLKEMEIYELTIQNNPLKEVTVNYKNTNRQLNEIRKTMHKQNEKFNK